MLIQQQVFVTGATPALLFWLRALAVGVWAGTGILSALFYRLVMWTHGK
jgi:hypothetical protein